MSDLIKLLRYNTGTDKKAFLDFKDDFDAVIFNATIVAYSGSAVADLVSVHKNRFIIDPQTHIFQHETAAIKTKNKKTDILEVKKSVEKYLQEMPVNLKNILLKSDRPANILEILENKNELTEAVYKFQTDFINKSIQKKEYSKYLEFVGAGAGPKPRFVIAPYFMLKSKYSDMEIRGWFGVNKELLSMFYSKNQSSYEIAAQLVLDKKVLIRQDLCALISENYADDYCKYIFIWIDNFSSFSANKKERTAFHNMLGAFRKVGKKPIMAYGGYDSILLCHSEISNRLYGVAQSVGYGEAREITPVGGGLPVNKYYFYPLHQRLNFSEAAGILQKHGYFNDDKTIQKRTENYYNNICNCKECHKVIENNINNFKIYNESVAFTFKRSGVKRNRPTTDASLIAAKHFLWCKIKEWESISKQPLKEATKELLNDVETYAPNLEDVMKAWCELYAK